MCSDFTFTGECQQADVYIQCSPVIRTLASVKESLGRQFLIIFHHGRV